MKIKTSFVVCWFQRVSSHAISRVRPWHSDGTTIFLIAGSPTTCTTWSVGINVCSWVNLIIIIIILIVINIIIVISSLPRTPTCAKIISNVLHTPYQVCRFIIFLSQSCKVLAPKCTNVFSCFMFMFWSKRTILTKRLLKAQVCREYETECETQENTSQRIARVSNLLAEASACSDAVLGGPAKTVKSLPGHRGSVPVSQPQAKRQTSSSGGGGTGAKIHQVCCGGADSQDESDEDEEDDDKLEDNEDSLNGKIEREARERLNRCKELLKNLKENQLEMLLTAIESCGADLGSCVVVARRPILNSSSQSDINTDQQQQQQPDPYRRRHSKRKSRHYHHPLRLRHSHHQFTRVRSRCRRYELHQGFNKDTEVLDESSSLAGTGCTAANDDERCLAVHSTPDPRTDFLLTSSAHLLSCQIWRWPDICLTTQLKKLPLCHSTKDPSYVCCNPYHWSRLCKPGKCVFLLFKNIN